MHTTTSLVAALCALSLVSKPCLSQSADAIYHGGSILTMAGDSPSYVEALAIKDGRITLAGSEEDALKLKGTATKLVDLGGKALLPGFIDAHGHLSMVGIQAASANMLPAPDGEGNSIATLQKLLKDWMAKNPKGLGGKGCIVGFGYDDSQLAEQRHPTRDDLDAVSKDAPVLVIHQSGHVASVNSKASGNGGHHSRK